MTDFYTVGTPQFESRTHAIEYYEEQEYDEDYVNDAIAKGRVHIGEPEVQKGEILSLDIMEGRYYIRRER